MIITKKEFDYVKSKKEGDEFLLDVDFGTRRAEVVRKVDEAVLEKEISLDLNQNLKDKFCYLLDSHGLTKITFFSESTNRFYKLVATCDWPTISISSVPMHNLRSPKKDTQNKIKLIKPYGYVLDTCMGLGYTAISAAQAGKKIITFERDENVFVVAKLNPLSKQLFSLKNIEIRKVDVLDGIMSLEDGYFDCVIHDPPTFKLSSELFSKKFYYEIMRVLKITGRMYHYVPLYKIKQGFDFPSKVSKRLKEVGFKAVEYHKEANGFICRK